MFSKFYVQLDTSTEICYYIEHKLELDINTLTSVIGPIQSTSALEGLTSGVFEIGPKLSFKTSWCSNALAILHGCGLTHITRIEKTYRMIGHEPLIDSMTEQYYHAPLKDFNVLTTSENVYSVSNIEQFAQDNSFGWDTQDLEYYQSLFTDRPPTNVELIDIAQSNSEHSRHHFFSGTHVINEITQSKTLFDMIRDTLLPNSNSVLAFCDNASAIQGYSVKTLQPTSGSKSSMYSVVDRVLHPTFTAETHNFPTGIAPFPGAATGVGGRVRDTIAIGRGGYIVAGTAGYCVADIDLLIKASDGASDYGNKLGEPIIGGFTREYNKIIDGNRWAWLKPIMFSGGIGLVADQNLHKLPVKPGLAIVRVGGPAYRIGVGGSTASSTSQNSQHASHNAVQRGDPEMENRMYKFVRSCIEMNPNPITSIHDQGAGGSANVTKEIVSPVGGIVDIRKITTGDTTLSTVEKWIAEYQEQVTLLTEKSQLPLLKQVARRENVDMVVFGHTTNDGFMRVQDDIGEPVCLDLGKIFQTPQKIYTDTIKPMYPMPVDLCIDLPNALRKVFGLVSVGSKRFLTTKVDRSVTGLIVQQQCIGPLHIPLSDYSLVAHSYFNNTGTVSSIGERPITGFVAPDEMGKLAVIEMLLNMVWTVIPSIQHIKCSVNWMWPAKLPGENAAMYQCMSNMSLFMKQVGIGADGGKDSISMYTKTADGVIKSPRNVVVSGYCPVPDFSKRVTADLKSVESTLLWIGDVCSGDCGSAFYQANTNIGNCGNVAVWAPTAAEIVTMFNTIQHLIKNNLILAGHDISDGGMITTVIEMAIAGNLGATIHLDQNLKIPIDIFSEHPGVIVQVPNTKIQLVKNLLHVQSIGYQDIGQVLVDSKFVSVYAGDTLYLSRSIWELRGWWDEPSLQCEYKQIPQELAKLEHNLLCIGDTVTYMTDCFPIDPIINIRRHTVAILRDEGSNGEREMAAAFYAAGFNVHDLTLSDLRKKPMLLDNFRGLVFVGGFTYSDVFGAGAGWASQIKHNQDIACTFERFRTRPDTFSLGICNGCQLMSLLGWIPACRLEKNLSGRFESRWSTVRVRSKQSNLLKDLDLTTFGIWVAHGEGRFVGDIPDKNIVMQYVNYAHKPTEDYPANPNGSAKGIAGVCSDDGRHLAMMPHPERCWMSWQCPWVPEWWTGKYTPWFSIFSAMI